MLRPKKNSYKEFDDEKKFLRLKNSPPPHNFSNTMTPMMIMIIYFRFIGSQTASQCKQYTSHTHTVSRQWF